ncbi:SDR family oxidoreductase [Dictyobacter arantiisoli]|uniref:Epimerase n=1 Tax=Dictyobacter arantiisoli TaxID=2014874 RepID=A0A5A5T746_9CHLR|nr:SDR family oxidoreductase [Dictyobacter arantiisoli]GCF07075.1 epimerase [Dictyobacter arantiisoli]
MPEFHGHVLVLGANGETGKQVLTALQQKAIPTRALVRTAAKAQTLPETEADIVIGEVDSETLSHALAGVSAVISTIGTRTFTDLQAIKDTEYTAIVTAIDAAKEAGVKHFVLCSSMGTSNPESIPPLTIILKIKARAEKYLQESGLGYTIVHPGGLRNEPGGQAILVAPHPLQGNGMITRADVAEVLVQALLQPAARGKSVDIVERPEQGSANRQDLFS